MLLRTIVQVTFKTLPRLISRCGDPSARSIEFSTGLGVGDRGRDEIGKVSDAQLGARR